MEKINLVKLLKDCPKGMELNCTMFDNVQFINVEEDDKPICIRTGGDIYRYLTKFGTWTFDENAKCVIFPKGKTTWEGFVPPRQFKDGDVIVDKYGAVAIYKRVHSSYEEPYVDFHCGISSRNRSFFIKDSDSLQHCGEIDSIRLATEEEKRELFDAIKANNYKWNSEKKTLEMLIQPKFKVGNKVKHKCDKNNTVITITGSKHDYYYIQYYNNIKNEYQNETISFTDQDKYELVPDKFDISNLKPFDKVLVRTDNKHVWSIQFFERINNLLKDSFVCMGGWRYRQCIPYEGNEHLLNTVNDCEDYFKNWQKS